MTFWLTRGPCPICLEGQFFSAPQTVHSIYAWVKHETYLMMCLITFFTCEWFINTIDQLTVKIFGRSKLLLLSCNASIFLSFVSYCYVIALVCIIIANLVKSYTVIIYFYYWYYIIRWSKTTKQIYLSTNKKLACSADRCNAAYTLGVKQKTGHIDC